MLDATSPLWGNLILAVALVAATIGMMAQRNRTYEAAMARYHEDMARYNEAVAAHRAVQPAISAGEVRLTGVDEKTAAMLIAIVCNTIGGDLSGLHFKAVKAL
jgi:hypothetical protein